MACNCHPDHDPRLDYVLGAIENTQAQMTALMTQAKALSPALHQQLLPRVAPLLKDQADAAKVCKSLGGVAYKGAFTPQELHGIVWLPNPLRAVVKIKDGQLNTTLAAMGHPNGKLTIFDKGVGEDGQSYGLEGPLTERQTSFLKQGDLPAGWLFDCRGFEVSVRSLDGSPVLRADMEVIGDWQLRYTEEGNTRAIRLGEVRRMPPSHRLELFGDDELVTGQFVGTPYRRAESIFRIRGGSSEKRAIEVLVDGTRELQNTVIVSFLATGLEGQRPQVT